MTQHGRRLRRFAAKEVGRYLQIRSSEFIVIWIVVFKEVVNRFRIGHSLLHTGHFSDALAEQIWGTGEAVGVVVRELDARGGA